MQGLNTVSIGGNLCRDAELRATASGMAVLTFSVAVNESRKNQQTGEYEDYPNYVDCTMLGRRAESVSRYLTKGTYVALTGRLHQNRWQNKDGQNRSKLEVTADNIHFESRRLDGDDYDQQQAEAQGDYEAQMYDEDIPF
jgi:single-strand DNA-binding protein|nr:MAG: single-strand binding protein family protein [Bacteriophage sp.]UVX75454.1 MAG: Single-strand binding protein family protein [Bacteriophage sp.]